MLTRGRKAFVTGASGFIGRHLVKRLAKDGWKVKALVRRESHGLGGYGIETVVGDVLDPVSLQRASLGADVFFHLAAQVSVVEAEQAPAQAIQLNVNGTLNALEACRANGVRRFIYLSTIHVIGSVAAHYANEESVFAPQSVYASSKLAAERLALAYGRAAGLEVAVLRPSNVYGPEQTSDAVIPEFIARALRGEAIEPRQPETRRNFIYVDDVTDALARAADVQEATNRAFNITGADSVSIGEVAELIQRATAALGRSEGNDFSAPRPSQRCEKLLGRHQQVSLRDGIARTVAAALCKSGSQAAAAISCAE